MGLKTRQNRYRAGVWAERASGLYLNLKGYRILARRFKSPFGEIDLIAKRRGAIAFVEVKYRKTLEQAAFSISNHQKFRIAQAAKFWLAGHPHMAYEVLRFDVVLMAPYRWPEHWQSAFEDMG